MSSRTTGGIAVAIGVLGGFAIIGSDKPIEIAPLLGCVAFIGLGGYYLITGKKAASATDFIVKGNLNEDEKSENP